MANLTQISLESLLRKLLELISYFFLIITTVHSLF